MLSWSQFEQLYTLCVLGSLTVTVFFFYSRRCFVVCVGH